MNPIGRYELSGVMSAQAGTPSASEVESGVMYISGTQSSWWAWLGGHGCTTTPTSAHWGNSREFPQSVGEDCTASVQSSSETTVGTGSSSNHVTFQAQ